LILCDNTDLSNLPKQVEKLKKSKISRLLDILPRRGPKAFQYFIEGLMESDQPDMARMLDESLAREWERNHPVQEHRKHVPPPITRQASAKVKPQVSKLPAGHSQLIDDEGLKYTYFRYINVHHCAGVLYCSKCLH
jgi:hypothetical protein